MSDARAALERGRPVLVVTPPAVEQAEVVWELVAPDTANPPATAGDVPPVVIVCADTTSAEDWADGAPTTLRVHPVTALERTSRLLRDGAVDVLTGTPEDVQALTTRSALKLDAVGTIVLAWPEWLLASGRAAVLEQVLALTPAARRVVLAWDPAALDDLLERHARRPHTIGDLPLGEDARPLPPVGSARYALVRRAGRAAMRRDVLDALDRPRVGEWRRGTVPEPADAVMCLDLPTRAELASIAAVGAPVLLLAPDQLPYARSIARPLTPLPLHSAWARARSGADAIRAQTAARVEAGGLEPELALLEPLLARYDAAEVAAAVLAIGRQPSAVSPLPTPHIPQPTPGWVRLFVNVGRKDKVGTKDLVGAMTRELGLPREALGRIEVRETFSLLNVSPESVDRVLTGLARVTIRGRRVSARRDRE